MTLSEGTVATQHAGYQPETLEIGSGLVGEAKDLECKTSLGYKGYKENPVFTKPRSWRLLESILT